MNEERAEALRKAVTLAVARTIDDFGDKDSDVSAMEVLKALEDIRHLITEMLLKGRMRQFQRK